MRAPNLFGVSDDVLKTIEAWLQSRVEMTDEERMANRPPAEFDRNWACSAQIAVSQLCAEQPLLVIVGTLAVCAIPLVMLVGSLFAR